jgi:hypothetical protein
MRLTEGEPDCLISAVAPEVQENYIYYRRRSIFGADST